MATAGDKVTMFALAAFVVLAVVGVAFAVGYVVGRVFL
jgi:hypothetical protein